MLCGRSKADYTVQQIFSLKKNQEQTDVLLGNLRALNPNWNLFFYVDVRIFCKKHLNFWLR